MKVKELLKKYPDYDVIEKGYPSSGPFMELPKELIGLYGKQYTKVCNELDVKGYKVISEPYESIDITHCIFGGEKRTNTKYKGRLEIYLRGTSKSGL